MIRCLNVDTRVRGRCDVIMSQQHKSRSRFGQATVPVAQDGVSFSQPSRARSQISVTAEQSTSEHSCKQQEVLSSPARRVYRKTYPALNAARFFGSIRSSSSTSSASVTPDSPRWRMRA
jgi:hypothetical protein